MGVYEEKYLLAWGNNTLGVGIMRKSQWNVLGIVFSGMALIFGYWTFTYNNMMVKYEYSWDTWFIIGRIYGGFALLTAGLAIISWYNSWFEGKAERKEGV